MKKHKDMSIKNLRIESKKIRAIAQASWFVGAFGPWFSPIPELKPFLGIGIYSYLALSLYRTLVVEFAIYDNTEYKEFTKIYKEVLDDMVNLSKTLDNKSAIDHYALYEYIVDHNYLSCDSSDNHYHDVSYEGLLAPEYTLNGHGVCRHQAAMGADYFKELGFENNFEVCRLSQEDSLNSELEFLKSYIEEEIEILTKEGREVDAGFHKAFLVAIEEKIKELNKDDKKKKHNNHAIIKVNEGENTYLFDSAQRTFYTASKWNPNIFLDYKGRMIDIGVNSKEKKKIIKASPVIPTNNLLPIDDIRSDYIKSMFKLTDNDDLVRKFNKENKDKLERAEEIYVKSLRK